MDGGTTEFHGRCAICELVFDFNVGEVLEDAALHCKLVEVSGDRELLRGRRGKVNIRVYKGKDAFWKVYWWWSL